MTVRLLHYSDIENAYDDPERIGRLAGLIGDRRDERTLVLGTGDNTAPGVLALATEGGQALDFFDAVSPDAETFGNHDFDFGPDRTRSIVGDSPQPWLSANVFDERARPFADVDPSRIVDCDGVRVGLFGLTDPGTPGMCPNAGGLRFDDPIPAARDVVADLRDEGVDYVIALSHLGAGDGDLARAVDVDVVLGGHVHERRCERIAGALCTRPNANGEWLWEIELRSGESRPRATCHRVADGPLDRAVANRLRARMTDAGLSEVVDSVDVPIDRARRTRYGGECRITNFVADAYRWATGANGAFVNTGGVRDGEPLSGDVTVADLIGVSPFRGTLHTAEVTGSELRSLVGDAASPTGVPEPWKRWLGHFAGVRAVWNRDTGRLTSLTVGGDSVDPDATYTLATNRFVLASTDWFPTLSIGHSVATHGPQYEALVDYARTVGVGPELDGRIRDVAADGSDD